MEGFEKEFQKIATNDFVTLINENQGFDVFYDMIRGWLRQKRPGRTLFNLKFYYITQKYGCQ